MKILVLEDKKDKLDEVVSFLDSLALGANIEVTRTLNDYFRTIARSAYDLIIVDLMVPRSAVSPDHEDVTSEIVEETRHHSCANHRTPIMALTAYEATADQQYVDLNTKGITVVTYQPGDQRWRRALGEMVTSCLPETKFDFVILCALPKEASAYELAGYLVEEEQLISGLSCRRLAIGDRKGAIVTAPRMGLVTAAILATQAIERFSPSLIAMSGICGGTSKAKIYDVVIPEACHQNDTGKWTAAGFQPEIYTVQLEHATRQRIQNLISRDSFRRSIECNLNIARSEYPDGVETLSLNVMLAPASSGSAVLADEEMASQVSAQQRKLHAFEMESYAVYESARLSSRQHLSYFSAKAVVDNGNASKGDRFHRVASIISAKIVYEIISAGIFDVEPH